jgi:hypothetical protein
VRLEQLVLLVQLEQPDPLGLEQPEQQAQLELEQLGQLGLLE